MEYTSVRGFLLSPLPPSLLPSSDETDPRERPQVCCRVNAGSVRVESGDQNGAVRHRPSGHLAGEPDSVEQFVSLRLYSKTRMMADRLHTRQPSHLSRLLDLFPAVRSPISNQFVRTTVQITQAAFSVSSWLETRGWSKTEWGASLVAQWLRICLPMQGTRVRALVREDPTCRGATKPVRHNY